MISGCDRMAGPGVLHQVGCRRAIAPMACRTPRYAVPQSRIDVLSAKRVLAALAKATLALLFLCTGRTDRIKPPQGFQGLTATLIALYHH